MPERPPASFRNVARYWLPALAWVAVVLVASSDIFSAQHTGSILAAVLTWILGHLNASTFETVHFLVRKSAHVTEYAILSVLFFRAVRGELAGFWRMRWALLGVAVSLSVAILDEWHQSFVPSRSGSARDVLLDFCGALFAQLSLWYASRREMSVVET